jgi:A/G-specific adenine glycosylase
VERLVAVLDVGERLFLVPRAEHGLLGGLWELPGCDGAPGVVVAGRLSRELSRRWGVRVRTGGEIAVAEHAITYRRIRIRAFRASIPGGAALPAGKWIRRRDLSRYPITTATWKILDRLEGVREVGGKPRRRRAAGRRRAEESRT